MKHIESVNKEKYVHLDLKNRKILAALGENARTPITQLAKKVGLTRDTTQYRVQQLYKNGIIQGASTIIDISKFGFQNFHLFLQMKYPSKEAEKVVIDKLKTYPFIRAILSFSGKYDLEIAMIAKNVIDCDNLTTQIIQDCGEYIREYEVLAITRTILARTFPKSFYDGPQSTPKKTTKIKVKLDQKHIDLLYILGENANTPYHEIASKLNLSADTIKYRITQLTKAGYIIAYVPSINYTSTGYTIYGVLFNIRNMTESKYSTFSSALNQSNSLLWAVKTFGKYNILAYICTKTSDEFHQTINDLRVQFSQDIQSFETLIAYQRFKYIYVPKYITL